MAVLTDFFPSKQLCQSQLSPSEQILFSAVPRGSNNSRPNFFPVLPRSHRIFSSNISPSKSQKFSFDSVGGTPLLAWRMKARWSRRGPAAPRRGAVLSVGVSSCSPACSSHLLLFLPCHPPLPRQPPAFNYVVEKSHNSAIQGGI